MAEVEEPQFTTLAERIAALNKQKNFSSGPPSPVPLRSPSTATSSVARTRPPPPPLPVKPATPKPAVRNGGVSSLASVIQNGVVSGTINGSSGTHGVNSTSAGRPPSSPVPPRGPPPKLPPRQPSGQHLQLVTTAADRRPSADSVWSHLSTGTTLSRVSSITSQASASFNGDASGPRKLPPAFGTVKLPPLPPSRREREAKELEAAEREAAEREAAEEELQAAWAEREAAESDRAPALPTRPGSMSRRPSEPSTGPTLPPRLPPRHRPGADTHSNSNYYDNDDGTPPPTLPSRRLSVKSVLSMGFGSNKSQARRPGPQQLPWRRNDIEEEDDDGRPPPLPMASRPSRAQIDAVVRNTDMVVRGGHAADARPALPTRPRPQTGAGNDNGGGAPGFYPKTSEDEECMKCRDFSEADAIAAQFPITNLPRDGTAEYLAHNLCDGFPSETDKARAIFTWCHHNIAYDVDGFFNKRIPRGQTLEERIFSGKAVCEGYAVVFEALALAAGLECAVVSGHGKGFGFQRVGPGDPVPPPNPTGHAWNAVRIDGGEWKLLDACWGAGNVCDKREERYEKKFSPDMFTMDNETFGERHFPSDPRFFFRADGRRPSWAEYVVDKLSSPPVILYSNAPELFIDHDTMEPREQEISVRRGNPDERIAFRLGRPCQHWSPQKQGHGLAPYPLMIRSAGPDGSEGEGAMHDVAYDAPLWFWADIPRRQLGRPGDMLFCYAITTLDGRDARGLTMRDVRARLGRCSYSMQAVCSWRLV